MWTSRFNKGGRCQLSTIEEFGFYLEVPRELLEDCAEIWVSGRWF